MESRGIACPSCGAMAAPDSINCVYCGAALQSIACPSCFGMMFFGSRFCPHCGARAASPLVERKAGDCPRCRQKMLTNAIGGMTLDECPACAGIWLDNDTFHELCESRARQDAFAMTGEPAAAPPAVDPSRRAVAYLPCPRCGELMNRFNFAGTSGVILSVCKDHGTWFDPDELRQVVEFIRAGGLQKAPIEKIQGFDADAASRHITSQLDAAALVSRMSPQPRETTAAGRLLRFLLDS